MTPLYVALLCTLASAEPIDRTVLLFEQIAAVWTPVLIDNETALEVTRAFDPQPRFIGGNGSAALEFPSDTATLTEAVWSSAVAQNVTATLTNNATAAPVHRCATVQLEASYTVEYFPTTSDFGGPGLYHKLMLSDDGDRDRWPSGLAFAFGGGTSPLVARRPGYDYTTPVAFVYAHAGNNTCVAEKNQQCSVYTNAQFGGRAVAGNYSVLIVVALDTVAGTLAPLRYTVAMQNDTYNGTVFDIDSFAGAGPQLARVSRRWLDLTPGTTAARLYFMVRRRTHLALRNLQLRSIERCAKPAEPAPTTTRPSTATPGPAQASTLAAPTASLVESAQNLKPEPSGDDGESGVDPTIYVFVGVACFIVCVVIVALTLVFRRRLRTRWVSWRYKRERGSNDSRDGGDDNDAASSSSVVSSSRPVLEQRRNRHSSQYSSLPIGGEAREISTYGDLGQPPNNQVVYSNVGLGRQQAPKNAYEQLSSRILNTLSGQPVGPPKSGAALPPGAAAARRRIHYDNAIPSTTKSTTAAATSGQSTDVSDVDEEPSGNNGSTSSDEEHSDMSVVDTKQQHNKKPQNHYDKPNSTLRF